MGIIKERFKEKADAANVEIKNLLKEHGNKVVGEVTLSQIYQGMRGITGLVTETSLLDSQEGIRFRGFTIPELQQKLPKAPKGEQPLPEGLFYLMLTGDLPDDTMVNYVTDNWQRRSHVPNHVFDAIDSLPLHTHPMTMFVVGVMALQTESIFAKKYGEGINKKDYWEPVFDDAMTLIARLPRIAAYIYRRKYKNSEHIHPNGLLDWAGNLAHMLGYEDHEIGASTEVWQSLLHPDDSERAQASMRDCLVNRETTNFLETFRLAHKDGHWVTVLSRAKIIRDSQGMAIRMVGTHLDRTEVEALEGALSEAWIKAEAETQSNEAKSKFLAAVSHEIRNPLNSIAGFARLIRDEVDNPELENYAQLLLQTTGSLNLILNDLLDFAKIEAGRFELSMGQFNLQSTVDELAQGARVLCDDKQIGFKLESALIPANLYIGDVVRVRQIIQNLLSNAIKFTHKGGVLLKLSISPSDGDFDCVTVEVGDTGIGMSEDKLRDLFKPFSQVHAADGNVYGGTGLGLSIVKSLVELMGGQVSCQSEAGKGSTFLVKFKLKRSDELYKPVGTAQDLEVKIKRRVLIADDAPSNLKILQTFLVKRGHFVCAASDGREALKLLGEHEFDVVLLDMDMPGKTGLEVVREVKESGSLNSRAKFACLSGHGAESMSDSALEGGFEQFFTKPLNLDDVLSSVNQET